MENVFWTRINGSLNKQSLGVKAPNGPGSSCGTSRDRPMTSLYTICVCCPYLQRWSKPKEIRVPAKKLRIFALAKWVVMRSPDDFKEKGYDLREKKSYSALSPKRWTMEALFWLSDMEKYWPMIFWKGLVYRSERRYLGDPYSLSPFNVLSQIKKGKLAYYQVMALFAISCVAYLL